MANHCLIVDGSINFGGVTNSGQFLLGWSLYITAQDNLPFYYFFFLGEWRKGEMRSLTVPFEKYVRSVLLLDIIYFRNWPKQVCAV